MSVPMSKQRAKEKRPLESGDKVKFRGPYLFQGGQSGGWAYEPTEVRVICPDDGILAHTKDGSKIEFYRGQVTHRLTPKPKVAAERVSFFLSELWIRDLARCVDERLPGVVLWKQRPSLPVRTFVELREGEIIIDRSKLAKAWDMHITGGIDFECAEGDAGFKHFCASLGLGDAGGVK